MEKENLKFDGLGIAAAALDFLDKMNFKHPTPIQHKAIPIALEGKDIIGIAQTGTGKTLAFGIPVLQRLSQMEGNALILVPTRELAVQVNETLKKLSIYFKKKSMVIMGGTSVRYEISMLRQNPDVIIATPGRLMDHMNQGNLHLKDVHIVVLDEADRMLDMGFVDQIKEIMSKVSKKRQTLLFSATMPKSIVELAQSYLRMPMSVEIASSGTVAEKVTQELFIVDRAMKDPLLGQILKQYHGMVLIFSRTKRGAKNIAISLKRSGHRAIDIHSDKSQNQREEALRGFKSGKYRILVATDIAARGIDVTGIELVVNYDLPDDPENYVHRIGRTGRAGHKGHAVSFATSDQGQDVSKIEQLMKTVIPISQHPEFPLQKFIHSSSSKPSYRRNFRGNRSGSRSGGQNRNRRFR